MSGTRQCCWCASEFHQTWAYLPSRPIATSSRTPGTYSRMLRLVKLASSAGSACSATTALTGSPRNLGQESGHGQQHHASGQERRPPINAYPSEAFPSRLCVINGFATVIACGHRSLLNSPVPTAKTCADFYRRPEHLDKVFTPPD